MAENVIDQIVAQLRQSATRDYPGHGELRAVRRWWGTHRSRTTTFTTSWWTFAEVSERIAAKVYRPSKCGANGARNLARTEAENLDRVCFVCSKKKGLNGVPRPLGDFTDLGAVVAEKK